MHATMAEAEGKMEEARAQFAARAAEMETTAAAAKAEVYAETVALDAALIEAQVRTELDIAQIRADEAIKAAAARRERRGTRIDE